MFLAFFHLRLTLYIYTLPSAPFHASFPRLHRRKPQGRRRHDGLQRSRQQQHSGADPRFHLSNKALESLIPPPIPLSERSLQSSEPFLFRPISGPFPRSGAPPPFSLRGTPDPVFRSRRPGVSVGGWGFRCGLEIGYLGCWLCSSKGGGAFLVLRLWFLEPRDWSWFRKCRAALGNLYGLCSRVKLVALDELCCEKGFQFLPVIATHWAQLAFLRCHQNVIFFFCRKKISSRIYVTTSLGCFRLVFCLIRT